MSPREKAPPITLEQARAVIAAHTEAEYAARAAEARKLIGRFFKYRNSYGAAREGKWWLYAMAAAVDDAGSVSGLTFQRASDERIEIKIADYLMVESGGWKEITATEFWEAAATVRAEVVRRLTEIV